MGAGVEAGVGGTEVAHGAQTTAKRTAACSTYGGTGGRLTRRAAVNVWDTWGLFPTLTPS